MASAAPRRIPAAARLPADWPHADASVFVPAAGLLWHVQQTGEGPDVLLVHGTGAASHSWRGLMPRLAARFRVTAIDLPGHGFTSKPSIARLSLPAMADAIAQLLRTLDLAPRLVIGHSAGAAILAHMCLERQIAPDLLVSINGAFRPFRGVAGKTFGPLARGLVLNPLVPLLTALRARTGPLVENLLERTGSTIDEEGVRAYRAVVRRPSHVAAAIGMMARWDLTGLWRDIDRLPCRLVLITGDADRTVSPQVSVETAGRVDGAVHERLAGLGHLAHEEDPAATAAIVERHADALAVTRI